MLGSPLFFLCSSGECCSEYLATAAFVEEVDNFLIVSVVERVLTQGKHYVGHSTIKQSPYGSFDEGKYGDK
jgi:hypothetical protein